MTFRQLDIEEQKLLKLMQTVDYGRLEQLSVCNGHIAITNASRKVQSKKIGTNSIPHYRNRQNNDFILTEKHTEFFREIRNVKNGLINVIQIQAGLPVSLEIEENITSL